jgi:hypothetical protein
MISANPSGHPKFPKRKILWWSIGGILCLVGFGVIIMGWTRGPDYDLTHMPNDQEFHSTRFEYRYGSTLRVIEDPKNNLRYGYGGLPDSISVVDGRRIVVFTSQKAVLRSEVDTVDVHGDNVQHKGYMGVRTMDSNYFVDSKGFLQVTP